MKKSILALAVVLGTTTTFAQDLTSKKGEAYLPEAGDWAIGVDATPFLNYVGNFFGKTGPNAAPTWNFLTTNQTISGKYFVEDGMAYRAALRIGFGSDKGSEMVSDRGSATVPTYPSTEPAMVENTYKMGSTNIGLAAGLEWRKGKGRLQGFYGAELGFMISSSKSEYTYGNAYNNAATAQNVSPSADDDMMGGANVGNDPFGNSARILSEKSGTMFGLGLRGFIGAEYFVLPKLAVGGEFGWGLGFMANGTSTTEVESEINSGAGDATEMSSTFSTETNNGSSFGVDTDNMNSVFGPAASLRITFHF